jgi:hypothetical protein
MSVVQITTHEEVGALKIVSARRKSQLELGGGKMAGAQ